MRARAWRAGVSLRLVLGSSTWEDAHFFFFLTMEADKGIDNRARQLGTPEAR
jgi:hypothetical protein